MDNASNTPDALPQQKVLILNGFADAEIAQIMKAVKALFVDRKALIFAKTTANSLTMTVGELIKDLSADHAYLLANPPQPAAAQSKGPAGNNRAADGPAADGSPGNGPADGDIDPARANH